MLVLGVALLVGRGKDLAAVVVVGVVVVVMVMILDVSGVAELCGGVGTFRGTAVVGCNPGAKAHSPALDDGSGILIGNRLPNVYPSGRSEYLFIVVYCLLLSIYLESPEPKRLV